MGVFPFLSPLVHCGQLLKEAVADESKFGELIQPYFQKEIAGRPCSPQLPQPYGLGGGWGHTAPCEAHEHRGAQPWEGSCEMRVGLSCRQRLCVRSLAGPQASSPVPFGGGGVVDTMCYSWRFRVFLFLENGCFFVTDNASNREPQEATELPTALLAVATQKYCEYIFSFRQKSKARRFRQLCRSKGPLATRPRGL